MRFFGTIDDRATFSSISAGMTDLPRPSRVEIHFSTAVLVVSIVAHLCLVFAGWRDESLRGNEFRQVQTAMAALYAQKEGCQINYPMPLLGSPWSAPMEFPFYQWAVAKVSTWTGWPLIQSGRAVSLTAFYAFLPAVWLLLGRAGLPPWQRRITLCFILASPTYVFYSRGFTIEPLALFLSLWFLACLVEALVRSSLIWFAAAVVSGIGAGLEKITTWLIFLIPVALWIAYNVVLALRRREPWTSPRWTQIFAVTAGLVLPCMTAVGWVRYSDALKADHASSAFLVSTGMTAHNFGSWAVRSSRQFWSDLNHMWLVSAGPPLLWILLFVASFWSGRKRPYAWGTLGLFFAAPMIFPILYSWHDYYFYANTVLLALGAGFVFAGFRETWYSFWPAWLVFFVCLGFQYTAYFRFVYPMQKDVTPGGSGLTFALRDLTNQSDILVIAGEDWNGFVPFYSQRRALMIRRNEESRQEWIARAFDHLRNDFVAVLILNGAQRTNEGLLELAVRRLDIDPRPVATSYDATIYANRAVRWEYVSRLFAGKYPDVTVTDNGAPPLKPIEGILRPGQGSEFFPNIFPKPYRFKVPYSLTCYDAEGGRVFFAHADSLLWFKTRPGPHKVHVEFGMMESSYTGRSDTTDGVSVAVVEQRKDGSLRTVCERTIDPAHNSNDRRVQTLDAQTEIAPGSDIIVQVTTGPHGNGAFDWAYIKSVRID